MTPCVSTIVNHVLASYPVIYVETDEPFRAERELTEHLKAQEIESSHWDIETGLKGVDGVAEGSDNPTGPMAYLTKRSATVGQPAAVLAHNLHRFWDDPEVSQAIINGSQIWKGSEKTLILIGTPAPSIPVELSKVIQLLPFDLPDADQRETLLKVLIDENKDRMKERPTPKQIKQIAEAGSGLTLDELESASALAFAKSKKIEPRDVMAQKAQMIRKNPCLEYYQPEDDRGLAALAGLENLKRFMLDTARSGYARGVLLLGVPGTGKSETAKGLGSELGIPTIILNMGRLFGSLVGESEQRTEAALRVIDAVSPCVLMIDEIEKALSGMSGSGKSDSGVSSRVFGTFLSWLQDHESNVYVIATCNDIMALPPEFSRAERWDAVFFLDLPNETEKRAIFEMYRDKFKLPAKTEMPLAIDYTGAEIRSLCRTAKMLNITPIQATKYVIPIAKSRSEMIAGLRKWAEHRAVPATDAQVDDVVTATRKMKTRKGTK